MIEYVSVRVGSEVEVVKVGRGYFIKERGRTVFVTGVELDKIIELRLKESNYVLFKDNRGG